MKPALKTNFIFVMMTSLWNIHPSNSAADLMDNCFRNIEENTMTCHGSLPSYSNESFVQLGQLDQLDVVHCHFDHVPKTAFQGMTALRSLLISCDNNAITNLTFAEDVLWELPKLMLLSLNKNNIMNLPPNFICNNQVLEYVFLWQNRLSRIENLGLPSHCNSPTVSTVTCGEHLSTLVLKGNSINTLPSYMLCTLKNLKKLDLRENKLATVEEETFYHLGSLLQLDLSGNVLTEIPENALRPLKNLRVLNVGGNKLSKNSTAIWKHLPNLIYLNMTNTGLGMKIENGSSHLASLRNLEALILDQNEILDIKEAVFRSVAGLLDEGDVGGKDSCLQLAWEVFYLNLDDWTLGLDLKFESYFTQGSTNHTGLKFLSLKSNNFTRVPSGIKLLRNLQVLLLDRNQIRDLNDDAFQNLSKLFYLHLTYNHIENISALVFRNLTCLMRLRLDHNHVKFINSSAFDTTSYLREIFLQHNEISSVGEMFKNIPYLKILDLSHNHLKVVSIDSFPLSLTYLDLSFNFIKYVSPSVYAYPLHLNMDILDLSHNQIEFLQRGLFPISLVTLLLNNNHISDIENCTFCTCGKLRSLDLGNNRLRTVLPEGVRINSIKLVEKCQVNLRGNDFVCDCQMKRFIDALPMGRMGIVSITDFQKLQCRPEFYKGSQTSLIIYSASLPETFLCKSNHTLNSSLSMPCDMYHDETWDFVVGDCSSKGLISIPKALPANVRWLYFDGNNLGRIRKSAFDHTILIQKLFLNNSHISEIEDNAFQQMSNLKLLNLENNLLHRLSGETFLGLNQLTVLNLFSNQLTDVNDLTFQPLTSLRKLRIDDNRLTTYSVWELAHLGNLTEIGLSHNPWSCECDYLHSYKDWLQESASRVKDVNTLFCSYGDNSTSTFPLISYDGSNCFGSLNFLESKYFTLTLCLSAFVVFAVISSALVFTYRQEIRVIVYYRYGLRLFSKNTTNDNDGDKIYDAFICYSHDDEAFVSETLLPGLEDIDPPFRLCVHSRDFIVGSFITDNIFEAVQKSLRTILILSENFIRSEWCRFEFKTAHLQMFRDPSHRVILIVRGEIPKNLHPEMKVYLKTNTYLMCEDRLFWERLYYAMPDRRIDNATVI